jgi:hypothetical protein
MYETIVARSSPPPTNEPRVSRARYQLDASSAESSSTEDTSGVEKTCVFCCRSEGHIVGPFHTSVGVFMVHEECCLWCPKVYLEESGTFMNVEKEIVRSSHLVRNASFNYLTLKKRCAHCGKHFAAIGCQVRMCRRTYHRHCAEVVGCTLNEEK